MTIPIGCDIITKSREKPRTEHGSIAQLGEHLPYKQRVIGSSPVVPTMQRRCNDCENGPVAQLVRAPACHAGGRGFEPHPGRQLHASVAQLVEQRTENPRVVGSIPTGGTIPVKLETRHIQFYNPADLAHLVERDLAKVEVAGSSPVIRSICGGLAQLGEHLPYKQRVIGSSPIVSTNGPVVQLVRTLACHARGRGFESHPGRHLVYTRFASVAQLVEQGTENPRVVGSIPTGGTIY